MAEEKAEKRKSIRLLCIDGFSAHQNNWFETFKDTQLQDGTPIIVEQTSWDQLFVSAYTHSKASIVCHLGPANHPIANTNQSRSRTFCPDFLLVRNEVRGAAESTDFRNQLFGLMYADIPSVNSLSSIYNFLERPLVHAELLKINRRLGDDVFPLVPQNYFASHREMFYGLPFPAVVKVGHAHAGFGKMKIANHHDFDDFRGVMALTSHYCTAEPFLHGEYDLRIQKIADHYRVFKRITISGNWKTNTGSSHLEEIELTPQYKMWADEACHMFGGLDICTVDVLHTDDGKEYILEVNGTSSGLSPFCAAQDNQYIKELVLEKMNAQFCKP